jgi:hypothetical protein
VEIGRHFPGALTLIAVAQNQHGDGFEDEAPDHAEGIGFTEGVDVAPTDDDGEELEPDDEVDDAIGGPVFFLPLEPTMAVFTAPERMRNPTTTTKARKARRSTCGPTMCMASPAIRLSLYTLVRTSSGISMTASKETRPVKTKLYMPMTMAVRFRFFSLGCASSR